MGPISADRARQIIEELTHFDTPSITNVVATYPADKKTCLGLYDPWQVNWYSDQRLKCMYPELGAVCGYAVTCVYGLPDPSFDRLALEDVLRAIDRSQKPVILAIKQDFPRRIKDKNGLCGGNMSTAFKALGVTGVLSDGPSRDIEEIRPLKLQYLLTGLAPGHGGFSVKAVNVPVGICGMDVAPGEIVHMDGCGACKFPAEHLERVLELVGILAEDEQAKMRGVAAAAGDVEAVIRAYKGMY